MGAALRFVTTSRSGLAGIILLLPLTLVVTLGPEFYTISPLTQDIPNGLAPISWSHPLGTDNLGRDQLARIMEGGRTSLMIGIVSTLIGATVATFVAVSGALVGGIYGACVQRVIDSLLAVPGIVQAIIWVAVIGRGMLPLLLALSFYTVPIFARGAYNATLQVIATDYYAAAVVVGVGWRRRILVHVMPNIAAPMIVLVSLRAGENMLLAAALSFFGLGVQPPDADWGLMIATGRNYFFDDPELVLIPGLALFFASVGFNLLGDGVRDWIDPRFRGRAK